MALSYLLFLLSLGGLAEVFPPAPPTDADAALQDEIEQLLAHPVDLNRATVSDLLVIPWLNPFMAHRILATRDSLGQFRSLEDLRLVPGWTRQQADAVTPFLAVGDANTGPTGRSSAVRHWSGSLTGRTRTDSASGGRENWAVFTRCRIERRPWEAVVLTEKDVREPALFDCTALGLGFRTVSTSVVLGDYAFSCGQGLVFSTAADRSSSPWPGEPLTPRPVRLVSSAPDGSGLRGGAASVGFGAFRITGLLSYAGRDARLNEDGTVERLATGGVHDDSAALAERNRLQETTAGASLAWYGSQAGIAITGSRLHFSHRFAPPDTSDSFAGQDLMLVGASSEFTLGDYRIGLEVAGTDAVRAAAALELTGSWQRISTGVKLHGHQRRFFAPQGRWRALTGTRDRLDASGRIRYRAGGFVVGLRGNTYRDFAEDSLPARIDLELEHAVERVSLGLALGRSYRADWQRCRTSRLECDVLFGRASGLTLTLADEYRETGSGHGWLAAVTGRAHWRWLSASATGAKIGISGTGMTMHLYEPGAMRAGSSYSSGDATWRTSCSIGIALAPGTRLGLKTGCSWHPSPVLDVASQLEVGLSGD